jgi:hypothetical protein
VRANLSNLFLDVFGFLGVLPYSGPVDMASKGFHTTENYLNKIIGRIGDFFGIVSVFPKIFKDGLARIPYRTEVIRTSAGA